MPTFTQQMEAFNAASMGIERLALVEALLRNPIKPVSLDELTSRMLNGPFHPSLAGVRESFEFALDVGLVSIDEDECVILSDAASENIDKMRSVVSTARKKLNL